MPSDLSGLFAAIAGSLVLVVVYWIWQSARLLRVDAAAFDAHDESASRDALREEKDALLRALRDLEMDRDVGKLSARDFERLNQRYRARARGVLRLLDAEVAPHRERARALIAEAVSEADRA